MSSTIPDYEIADTVQVSTAGQLRAYADPLRMTRLDLALERAATVAELAEVVDRPKSTVAHHVGALVDAA
jgi:DNA-binding transcriptional ArsR family regulator